MDSGHGHLYRSKKEEENQIYIQIILKWMQLVFIRKKVTE